MVLPASMCATIPMLRTLDKSFVITLYIIPHSSVDARAAAADHLLDIGFGRHRSIAGSRHRERTVSRAVIDGFGRKKPKHAHGTTNLESKTSSAKAITEAVLALYDRIVDKNLTVRRLTLVASRLTDEDVAKQEQSTEQLDFFSMTEDSIKKKEASEKALAKEQRLQKAVLGLKKKYGKNAVLKGMNFQEGATMIDRNGQIGGHKA